jgi:hypothetical protein
MVPVGVGQRSEVFDRTIEDSRVNKQAVRGNEYRVLVTIHLELVAGNADLVQFWPDIEFKINKLGKQQEFALQGSVEFCHIYVHFYLK